MPIKKIILMFLFFSGVSHAAEDFIPGAKLRLVNLSTHRVDFKFGRVGAPPINPWQQANRVGLEPNDSILLENYMIPCDTRFCVEVESKNPRDPSVLEYFNENHREHFVTFLKAGVAVVIDVAVTQALFDEGSEFRTYIEDFINEYKEEGIKAAVKYLSDLDLEENSIEAAVVNFMIKNIDKVGESVVEKAVENAPDLLMSYALAKFMLDYAIDQNSDNWLNQLREQYPKTVEGLATSGCFAIHKGANKFYKSYSAWALANPYTAAGKAAAKTVVKGAAYYSKYLYDTKKTTSSIIKTEKDGVFIFGHNQRIEVIVTDYNQYTVSMRVTK